MKIEGFIGFFKFYSCFYGDQNIFVLLLLYFDEICVEYIFVKDFGVFKVVIVCRGVYELLVYRVEFVVYGGKIRNKLYGNVEWLVLLFDIYVRFSKIYFWQFDEE